MAGNPGRAEQIADLKRELRVEQAEKTRYMRLLAGVAPELLKADRAPTVKEYSPKIHDRILLLADMGYSQNSWIAELGITKGMWHEWKNQYPELIDCIDRALVKALAWWEAKARKAQDMGNKTFALSVYNKRTAEIKAEIEDIPEDIGLGDASKLVLLDLRQEGHAGSEGAGDAA